MIKLGAVAVAVVAFVVVALALGGASPDTSRAQALEEKTFSAGTSVIPMDGHQADVMHAFGLAHGLLREGITIYRIIEPPDVTLVTAASPGGDVYQGGPILVEETIPAALLAEFPGVTIETLSEEFTSDQVFTAGEPTEILVIQGAWGYTQNVLDDMGIPYDLVGPLDVEADPGMLSEYTLVVDDCGGWFGSVPPGVDTALQEFVTNGGELIFTDIALLDLNKLFAGYVTIVGNVNGTYDFTVHPLAEYPGQYAGPTTLFVYTMGGGQIASEALDPSVRVLLDAADYAGEGYRIGAFYFPYGDGIVEGFAYHPGDQTGEAAILSATLYGNKFIHTPPPPNQPPDCSKASPSVAEIWPPNHKMVGVNILGVTDPDGDPTSIVITGITQDEPVNGLGDGDTSPDGAGVGTDTAQVRAERAGTPKVPGNGRMYHIHFDASDGKGGLCSTVVNVGVPHDQRRGHVIVDGGELFNSTVP